MSKKLFSIYLVFTIHLSLIVLILAVQRQIVNDKAQKTKQGKKKPSPFYRLHKSFAIEKYMFTFVASVASVNLQNLFALIYIQIHIERT